MTLLNLAGSVALLLWGVHMVQTGVQRAFGAKLRSFLGHALKNRFKAFLAGLGVTMLDVDDPIQAQAADAFVMAHADGTPFHRIAWLRAITQATGHRALLLTAFAPSGQIRGLLPLHHVKSRLFGDALVSSAFAVDGGLLVADDRAAAALAAAAQGLARDRGGPPLELRGGPAPGGDWHVELVVRVRPAEHYERIYRDSLRRADQLPADAVPLLQHALADAVAARYELLRIEASVDH